MRIKFSNFLREYRVAPLGAKFDKEQLINFLADKDNLELLRTHTSTDSKDFVIFEYTIGSKDKLFIMVNRVNYSDCAAYMFIKKFDNFWQVQDVSVYDEYRNLGLGTDLYVKVIDSKYDLLSGFSLSNEAEKLWRNKLTSLVNVEVYDRSKKVILALSDLWKNDVASDTEQRYFYIARSKKQLPEGLNENALVDLDLDVRYERWIVNDPTYILHGFRSSKYGNAGEF